jgi:NADH:ubiquinone oxidoreductase subunit E
MALSGNGGAAPAETAKTVTKAKEIVAKMGRKPGYAISLLQKIQKRRSYLPQNLGEAVLAEGDIPVSNLYGLRHFTRGFGLSPGGNISSGCVMGRPLMRLARASVRRSSPRSWVE